MKNKEILQRLEEARSHYKSGFSASERTLIVQLYGSLLGKEIRNLSCNDCYRDAFIELYTHVKKATQELQECNYRLKDGAHLHLTGTSEYIVNPVSDKVAEGFLRRYPKLIDRFARYPSDWMDRIKETEKARTDKPTKKGGKKGKRTPK